MIMTFFNRSTITTPISAAYRGRSVISHLFWNNSSQRVWPLGLKKDRLHCKTQDLSGQTFPESQRPMEERIKRDGSCCLRLSSKPWINTELRNHQWLLSNQWKTWTKRRFNNAGDSSGPSVAIPLYSRTSSVNASVQGKILLINRPRQQVPMKRNTRLLETISSRSSVTITPTYERTEWRGFAFGHTINKGFVIWGEQPLLYLHEERKLRGPLS